MAVAVAAAVTEAVVKGTGSGRGSAFKPARTIQTLALNSICWLGSLAEGESTYDDALKHGYFARQHIHP